MVRLYRDTGPPCKVCKKGDNRFCNRGTISTSSGSAAPTLASSAQPIADRMFDTMAAAKAVRDASRQVLREEQKEKDDYLAAEERKGNIKKTSVLQKTWTRFTSWFGKLPPFYGIIHRVCVCVCVSIHIYII